MLWTIGGIRIYRQSSAETIRLGIGLLGFQRRAWWGCSAPVLKVETVGHHGITDQANVNIVEIESASELSGTENGSMRKRKLGFCIWK